MTYIFEKGTSGKHLILLHGTGGDEHSLLDIAHFLHQTVHCFLFVARSKKMG
ncbi:TPA: hypothetical protein KT859_002508 [Enterococcus faecium]|nr:hypothetical protein [Enterococcus faecium]HBH6553042.1 hypothetical protein [Enterococcus faecium]HBK6758946.1 hypothetical protein [Enterococcus faecium]